MQGETLCGACRDACPVAIDSPRMLLELRHQLAEGDPRWGVERADPVEAAAFRFWSLMVRDRKRYERFLRLSALGQKFLPKHGGMIRKLPPPVSGWTAGRDSRPLPGRTFVEQWHAAKKGGRRE